MTNRISNKKLSFYITLGYVILATIYTFWAMTDVVSDGILYYFFFPATIIPSIILFTEREPGIMILICQAITLFMMWPLFWLFVQLFRKDNKKHDVETKS